MLSPSGWSQEQGWQLTAISSCLCLLGCMIVLVDDIYYLVAPRFISNRYPFRLKENYSILNGCLSFSGGCLIFTALARLLPEATNYIHESLADSGESEPSINKRVNATVIVGYVVGVSLYVSFNAILHVLTSESVVHCDHSGQEDGHSHQHWHNEHDHDTHSHDTRSHDIEQGLHIAQAVDSSIMLAENNHGVNRAHSASKPVTTSGQLMPHKGHQITEDEGTPLIQNQPPMSRHASKKSLFHLISPHSTSEVAMGECKGYSSAEVCLFQDHAISYQQELHSCELPTLTREQPYASRSSESLSYGTSYGKHDSENEGDDHSIGIKHHHHVTSPFSRLLLIGIQTTLAITLHKLPEGFITFVTSQTNPQLGFSIFLSLAVHNFTEGFSMCLPLFYSFDSSNKKYAKLKAIAVSGTLGAFSQPLGAFFGYLFLAYNNSNISDGDINSLNYIFGITLAVTGGFLSVIALTMYGSAISFGGSINYSMFGCVLGSSVIGLTSIFSVH